MGAEFFHADGQMDVTKQIVAFRDFANAPNRTLCGMTGGRYFWQCAGTPGGNNRPENVMENFLWAVDSCSVGQEIYLCENLNFVRVETDPRHLTLFRAS
jgi:hypothetical protein